MFDNWHFDAAGCGIDIKPVPFFQWKIKYL